MTAKAPLVVLVAAALIGCSGQEPSAFKRIRECLSSPSAVVCLKEEAVEALNQTIMSEKPMRFFDLVDVEKDPNYRPNLTQNDLPEDVVERNSRLNDLLYNKVEELFESRTVKFSLATVIEGRKKKDKGGGMMMMAGLAMAGMMGQMFMGKVAFLAGAALLVAKMALMLSAISALKKSGGNGGGGGETQHIVYTTSSDSGGGGGGGYGHSHGGGGGGWHRSLSTPDTQSIVYAGQMPTDDTYPY